VTVAFIDQASGDIREKRQRLERQNVSLRDLVQVAEKVYYNRETEEEKEQRKKEKRQGRNLQRVLSLRLEDEYRLSETSVRPPQDLD
jgi:DNA mismatch repair ATPase MutS